MKKITRLLLIIGIIYSLNSQGHQSVVFSEAVFGVGLNEVKQTGLELFHNPFLGNFNLRLPAETEDDLRLDVTDVYGREILNRLFQSSLHQEKDEIESDIPLNELA